MSIAVLPPIAASTWPTSVVGTATHGTPRRYVAAAKPAASVRAAAAERDDGARLGRAAAPTTAVETTSICFASSPAGSSCVVDEPLAERLLGARAVDAHHRRVGDERDRPVARNELAEPVERAALVVDAGRGERRTVASPLRDDRVGDLAVQRRRSS